MKRDYSSLYRLLSAPFRVMPEFFIPGEAKCGTTSLYRYITSHPQIMSADEKEPNNFRKYGASPLFCRKHYPLVLTKLVTSRFGLRRVLAGEASPDYLASGDAARAVSALVPHARLIVMMRNPVTRCFSDYQMMKTCGWEAQQFDEGVERHLQWLNDPELQPLIREAKTTGEGFVRYISKGVYADNITIWQKYFPKEQFCFVKSEDFFGNPQGVLDDVFGFLGVPPIKIADFPVLKKGSYQSSMTSHTIERLSSFYKPCNERLYSLIGRDMGWEKETEEILAASGR